MESDSRVRESSRHNLTLPEKVWIGSDPKEDLDGPASWEEVLVLDGPGSWMFSSQEVQMPVWKRRSRKRSSPVSQL